MKQVGVDQPCEGGRWEAILEIKETYLQDIPHARQLASLTSEMPLLC